MSTPGKITVLYDGACDRCVKDRQHYECWAGDTAGDVEWLDITGQDEYLQSLGIDPLAAMLELHIIDQNQQILSELDAYIVLMRRVPRLKFLAWVLALPLIRPTFAWLYHRSVERRLHKAGRL